MARKQPSRPSVRYPVTTEYDGKTYEGEYSVEGRPPMVYVYFRGEKKATQKGNSPAEVIARMVLHQMVASFR